MSDIDPMLDRVAQRRRLLIWRVVAVLAFAVAVFAVARPHGTPHRTHLALLKVEGLITDDSARLEAIDDAAGDPLVKGMVLRIDSPGGTVSGGTALHDALARFAAKKPLVVVMEGTAASAGYMIAVPAARIFASNATLTGSIGVLMQAPDISGLLGKLGISVDMMVSGPLKGQSSVVHPLSPEGRAMLQGLVEDYYGQFVAMVAAGRHLPEAKVRQIGDGRPYTGRQALALGLVDQIGTQSDARDWLARERHVATGMPLDELKPRKVGPWWRRSLHATVKSVIPEALVLDGPVALWQP